ncbi:Bacterial alpha-L-rhamnosidase [Pirellulimonas nuda]|uniref:Probable pectate lyase C n=1 Tax=Pirellulimonas nuda TaxID=2528009 RepID=A0A518DAR5_9BACT|nr:alpha-L-rhamnosidase N-terminal domain-containing protein [Pirellulimonas nuda]QDU88571.1 Bacterial alpha-L-rhamnosidase [Pirellulimonas nuda]
MELVSSRSGRRLALLLACVCLQGVGHAPAATVYVAPWGDDANPGAFDQPKRNAQIALNALQPGDTLYFREGLYSLNGPLTLSKSGSPDNWITIASAPGETAVLDGALSARDDDSILEVRGQNYVKIENLRLQNSKDQGISVWKSKHVVIQNNHTYNTYGPGIGVWGDAGAQAPSQYITVWNNKVEKPNSWDAPGEHPNPAPNHPPHEGISLGRVEDFEVAYNEVWGGQKEGIDSKGPNKRGVIHHNYVHDLPRVGIYVDAWTSGIEDIEIHNNIVHDSYSSGLSGLVSINSEDNQTVDNVRVHHNLGYNIKRRIFHVNGSPLTSNVKIWNNTGLDADHGVLLTGNLQDITIENNILNNIRFQILKDDSSGTGRTIDYNLLNANPTFANASSDDYRLAPGSSAIDAGNPDPAYNDPDGSRNDIGAFYLGQTNTSWDYWLGAGWDQGAPPHPWDLNDPVGPGGADPGYEPAVLLFADDFILDPLAPGPVGRGGAAPLPTNGWAESGAWTNSAEPDAQGVVRSVARGLSGSLTRAISTEGYHNVAIELFVMQDESASYETLENVVNKSPDWGDYFELQINTGGVWETVLLDHGQWNGQNEPGASGWSGQPGSNFNLSTGFIDLPSTADDNANLQVRLITHASQPSEVWFIEYFQLRGDTVTTILAGDYNNDGQVDAADYSVWRDHYGGQAPLTNDPYGDQNLGPIGTEQYDQWRSNFGRTGQQGATSQSLATPEPRAIHLAVLLLAARFAGRHRWLATASGRRAGAWLLALCMLAFQAACPDATWATEGSKQGGSVKVTHLRCDSLENPRGIDRAEPRLAWRLEASPTQRGVQQTAYHVLVASSPETLDRGEGDLWDSGVVQSDRSISIPYAGAALRYGARCYWKVKVRLADGQWTPWSGTASWSMGPMNRGDWSAEWIGSPKSHVVVNDAPLEGEFFADPWVREEFDLPDKPTEAVIYVASIGYHELYVNGTKIGDTVLEPCVSDHSQRARYVAYDIAGALRPGKNVIGFWLGTSWSIFRPYQTPGRPDTPLVLAQADLKFPSGETIRIATDGAWKTHPSPNVLLGEWWFRNYGGEFYDAGREAPGWCDTPFDDSAWNTVRICPLELKVTAAALEPNRRVTKIEPQAIEERGENQYRIDMGVNYAGLFEIDLTGQPGDLVTLDWSEHPDERRTHNIHSAFRIGPTGKGTFQNRFNYGSGRWITIGGLRTPPKLSDARGYLVRSDFPRVGRFECSDPLLNKIYDTTCWTFENLSLGGYVVDCPQRERMGYGGDAHATTQMAVNTYGLAAFYSKWCEDWRDVQGHLPSWGLGEDAKTRPAPDEGALPYTAPTYWGGGGPIWSGICITLPWLAYRHYGDQAVLEDNFPMMQKWLAYLDSKSEDDLLLRFGGQWDFLGDWLWPGASGINGDTRESLFLNNCFWVHNLETAAKVAAALDRPEQAAQYAGRAEQVRQAIHREFFDEQSGGYVSNLQACLAIALMVDVPPSEVRPRVEHRFVDEVLIHRDGHFWGGITGGYFIFGHLLQSGRNDLAYTMVSKPDYPGWGNMMRQGATTLWESWEGHKSRLHSSYLHVGPWFMEGLAGIVPDDQHAGYKHFFVRPGLDASDSITWVRASYDSPYGEIRVAWEKIHGELRLRVTAPPNTSATLCLPIAHAARITEGGTTIEGGWITQRTPSDGQMKITIGSGEYDFVVPLADLNVRSAEKPQATSLP